MSDGVSTSSFLGFLNPDMFGDGDNRVSVLDRAEAECKENMCVLVDKVKGLVGDRVGEFSSEAYARLLDFMEQGDNRFWFYTGLSVLFGLLIFKDYFALAIFSFILGFGISSYSVGESGQSGFHITVPNSGELLSARSATGCVQQKITSVVSPVLFLLARNSPMHIVWVFILGVLYTNSVVHYLQRRFSTGEGQPSGDSDGDGGGGGGVCESDDPSRRRQVPSTYDVGGIAG